MLKKMHPLTTWACRKRRKSLKLLRLRKLSNLKNLEISSKKASRVKGIRKSCPLMKFISLRTNVDSDPKLESKIISEQMIMTSHSVEGALIEVIEVVGEVNSMGGAVTKEEVIVMILSEKSSIQTGSTRLRIL